MKTLLLRCLLAVVATRVCSGQVQWGSTYTVQGVLHLPYAEIKEPFMGYFDATRNLSRVDYYGDMVQTVQVAGNRENCSTLCNGVVYKIAYMPNKATWEPERTCFQVNGTENITVTIQSVLPDVRNFTFSGSEPCMSDGQWSRDTQVCDRYDLVETIGAKVNRYTLWVSLDEAGDAVPRRYLMHGYNTLLGSHYDKYEVLYSNFQKGPFNPDVFNISSLTTAKCRGFPGPGAESLALHNPMAEFMNNHDAHVHQAFDEFKEVHGKRYTDSQEHEKRMNIFRQNLRFIHSTNRANLGYNVAVNHLADQTDEELLYLRGKLKSSRAFPSRGRSFPMDKFSHQLPESVNWWLLGAVTPVKDQAVCGSCWSFGTVGHLEGALFVKTGRLVRLAEQQLIDCSWLDGNNGCDGGEDFRAYHYIQAHGLASDEDYGSYLGQDGICHDTKVNKTIATIKSYVNVTTVEELRKALANVGPISVSIDASHKSFSFYSNGVYYEPKCRNDADGLDHSVLAVGYGVQNDQQYWLVKNSWSTYWGNDGYVLMSQKDNNCGVATQATYVEL
ncbi:digestive cysteine proteinase 2-like [Ornithodoros turicata]|uniref:digestive cysteine proteinase 2-like n=1 Tax=Ornithodoros turicata TaxID=34597 RepID=UPI0031391BB2